MIQSGWVGHQNGRKLWSRGVVFTKLKYRFTDFFGIFSSVFGIFGIWNTDFGIGIGYRPRTTLDTWNNNFKCELGPHFTFTVWQKYFIIMLLCLPEWAYVFITRTVLWMFMGLWSFSFPRLFRRPFARERQWWGIIASSIDWSLLLTLLVNPNPVLIIFIHHQLVVIHKKEKQLQSTTS